MKKHLPNRVRNFGVPVVFILLVLIIAVYIPFALNYKSSKDSYFKSLEQKLTNEYQMITGIYTDIARIIFGTEINTDEIKGIFYKGITAENLKEKNYYRKELQTRLQKMYSLIHTYLFRQLHFHEADNVSFLRMHRPSKYGDDLTDIRSSVKFVNENKQFISGFEEGRIFNGYRNVFPLNYKGEHIGSVEISISFGSVIDKLEELFNEKTQFLLLQEQIYRKVFESELSNYSQWPICNLLVVDKAIDSEYIHELDLNETSKLKIRNYITACSWKCNAKVLVVENSEKKYLLTFMPINNFENKSVAFLVSVNDSLEYNYIVSNFKIITSAFSLICLILLIFVVYYYFSQKHIQGLTTFDHLTGLLNRRTILELVEREYNRFHRYGHAFSLVMIDLDHFKEVNDTAGHREGDRVLKIAASLIMQNIRATDYAGRYGGEEILLLIPDTGLKAACSFAEKLRAVIEDYDFNNKMPVTISCGAAAVTEDLEDYSSLINFADSKMYEAKKSGRNRVSC